MTEYVLITGGSQNIGGAISRRLREDGYQVLILDRVPPEGDDLGRYFEVDLSSRTDTAEVLRRVTGEYEVTRLVNNVGIVKPALLEDTRLEDFDAVMDLNVRCAIQCLQALLPTMRDKGFGRVVSISSRTALGKTLRTNYSASKAALHGMSRTWALELAADGITVNCVAPGTIETSAFHVNNPPDDPRTRAIIDAIPAGRIGQPADVANGVSFFMDERSSFVTGQVIYVCGGLTIGLAR